MPTLALSIKHSITPMVSQELSILGISAAITAGIQFAGFLVAYCLQTEKFYDVLGGLNFLTIAIYSAADADSWGDDPRKIACTIVFICSRLWLLLFLAWRAHERNGDSRFDNVKDKFVMFFFYWSVQGIWVFTISLPMILVNSSDKVYDKFSILDIVSITLFALAVVIEITADVQKARWVKRGRPGTFCTVGVWNYSRHPNYFGEMMQWWMCWLFSFSSGTGFDDVQWWCSILSPLFTMQVLLNTSGTGVPNANGANLKRYYDACPEAYTEYRKSTSILIPFIGYKYVPMFLKRTIFLDFKRFEYPGAKDTKCE